jgi:hypothetical protein
MKAIYGKCGKGRGCRIVVLPTDIRPNWIYGNNQRNLIRICRLSAGRTPNWKVVRWDSDEDARELSKAAG